MTNTAIITVDTTRIPPETRVGGVSVLSRAIVVCQKAKFQDVIIAVDGPVQPVRTIAETHWKVAEDTNLRWVDWTDAEQRSAACSIVTAPAMLVAPDGIFFPDTLTSLAAQANDRLVAGVASVTDTPAEKRYTGLAVIPAPLFGEADSVTALQETVSQAIENHSAETSDIPDSSWRPVTTTRKSIRAAKRLLFTRVTKPTSGFVSKRINSLVSIPLSKILVELPITPNNVSVSTIFIGFASAALLTIDAYWALCLSGLLWQFAAIVDRCDGEVARTKHMETVNGAWFDTMCDQSSYLIYYLSVIFGMTVRTDDYLYFWFGLFTLGIMGAAVLVMMQYAKKRNIGSLQLFSKDVGDVSTNGGLLVRAMSSLKFASKRDFFSFVFMWLCVFNLFPALYWALTVGSLLVAAGIFAMNRRISKMAPAAEAAS